MGLALYDADKVLLPMTANVVDDPVRTLHDGRLGGPYELLLYIRNDDPALYFHNVEVQYTADAGIDSGPLGNTGWTIKYSYGERQPTEAEWDQITSGATVAVPDIGAPGTPDTSTYQPFWIRVYCPGETAAQLRMGQTVTVAYLEDMV